MTTTSLNKLVQRRLNDFKRRCGEYGDAALELAYHAALPVALNPELLHFLRINFFLDLRSPLPYTVEFEFLTSGLCREIDAELYEIEPEIRDVLLQELRRKYGLERIQEVATLLWQYVEHHSPWADRVELERSQQLTALNFLDPVKAKQWLDTAETNASQAVGAEREWFIAMRQGIQKLQGIQRLQEIQQTIDLVTSELLNDVPAHQKQALDWLSHNQRELARKAAEYTLNNSPPELRKEKSDIFYWEIEKYLELIYHSLLTLSRDLLHEPPISPSLPRSAYQVAFTFIEQRIPEYIAEEVATEIKARLDYLIERLHISISSKPQFDVFLSYDSGNSPQVREIAQKLKNRGLKVWLYEEQIPPGSLWSDAIQQAIRQSKTAAVFIGKSGLKSWQTEELNILQYEDIRVISVLLPGVDLIPENLPFLGKGLTWVRFERGIDDTEALDRLESSITGQEPLRPSPLLLSGNQSKQLREALLEAFPTHSALKQMVRSALNINLNDYLMGDSLSEIVSQLIERVEAEGQLEKLLTGVLRFNPKNSQLRIFYDQVRSTSVAQEISIEESTQIQSDRVNFPEKIPSSQVVNIFNKITIVPEPKKVPFPQADKFERVENLLSLLSKKDLTSEEITENYKFTLRQTRYYTGAGKYLGLISKGTDKRTFTLTDEGKNIVEKDYETKFLDLTKVILQHEAFYKIFKTALDIGRIPSNDVIVEIMSTCRLNMNEGTMKRRAATVRGWIEWIWSKIDWGISP